VDGLGSGGFPSFDFFPMTVTNQKADKFGRNFKNAFLKPTYGEGKVR